jgi:hypothetical protein
MERPTRYISFQHSNWRKWTKISLKLRASRRAEDSIEKTLIAMEMEKKYK